MKQGLVKNESEQPEQPEKAEQPEQPEQRTCQPATGNTTQ